MWKIFDGTCAQLCETRRQAEARMLFFHAPFEMQQPFHTLRPLTVLQNVQVAGF